MATTVRNGIKQNSKIKIAGESVYLGKQVDGMFRVYLDEYIPGAGAKEVTLFKETFSTKPPSIKTCGDAPLVIQGLKHRRDTLNKELAADMHNSASSRQKFMHAQELDVLIKEFESVHCTPGQAAVALPIKAPVEIGRTMSEEEIRELARRFAILILHAQKPVAGFEAYTQPAKNVIGRLRDMEKEKEFMDSYKAGGGAIHPILEFIMGLGTEGAEGYEKLLSEKGVADLLQDIIAEIRFDVSKDQAALFTENLSEEEPRLKIQEIISRILQILKKSDNELLAQDKAAAELQTQIVRLREEAEQIRKQLSLGEGAALERDELRLQIVGMEKKLRDTGDSVAGEKREKDAVIHQATADNKLKADKIASLDQEIARVGGELKRAEEAKRAAEALAEASRASLGLANQEVAKLGQAAARITELEGQIARTKDEKDAAEARAVACEGKQAAAAAELDALRVGKSAAELAVIGDAGKLAEAESALAAATAQVAEAKRVAEEAQKQINFLKTEQTRLGGLSASAQTAYADLSKQKQEIEGRAKATEAELAAEKELVQKIRGELGLEKSKVVDTDKRLMEGRAEAIEAVRKAQASAAALTQESEKKLQQLKRSLEGEHQAAVQVYEEQIRLASREYSERLTAYKGKENEALKQANQQVAALISQIAALKVQGDTKDAAHGANLVEKEKEKVAAIQQQQALLKKWQEESVAEQGVFVDQVVAKAEKEHAAFQAQLKQVTGEVAKAQAAAAEKVAAAEARLTAASIAKEKECAERVQKIKAEEEAKLNQALAASAAKAVAERVSAQAQARTEEQGKTAAAVAAAQGVSAAAIKEATKTKETAVAAAEKARDDAIRLLKQQHEVDLKAISDGKAAEIEAALKQERAQEASKIEQFAAKVLADSIKPEDIASYADNKPLHNIMQKVDALTKKPSVNTDLCILVYFVSYFMDTMINPRVTDDSRDMSNELFANIESLLTRIEGRGISMSDLLKGIQTPLSLANKLKRDTTHPMAYYIEGDQSAFTALYEEHSKEPLNEIRANLVVSDGNVDRRKNFVLPIDQYTVLVKNVVTSTDTMKLQMKVYDGASLPMLSTQAHAQQTTKIGNELKKEHLFTYDSLFLIYLFATKRFVVKQDHSACALPIGFDKVMAMPAVARAPVAVTAPVVKAESPELAEMRKLMEIRAARVSCTKLRPVIRSSDPKKGVVLSPSLATYLSETPFCLRDRGEPLTHASIYMYKSIIDQINDAWRVKPVGTKAPPGFIETSAHTLAIAGRINEEGLIDMTGSTFVTEAKQPLFTPGSGKVSTQGAPLQVTTLGGGFRKTTTRKKGHSKKNTTRRSDK
jgi:hypothetical protein